MINHPSVMHAKREWVYERGDWKSVLVVETSLQINPTSPDYDPVQEAALQSAIVAFMEAHPSLVDSVYVQSRRADV